jgi:hypothetical protein
MCANEHTFRAVEGEIADSVKWNLEAEYPFNMTFEEFHGRQCDPQLFSPGLKQIIPIISEVDPVVIYHACPINVYTSMKRDCLKVPQPDPSMLKEFVKFVDEVFNTEIIPILEDFDYDFNSHFNKLNKKQQSNLKRADLDNLEKRLYQCFCKTEKQIVERDEFGEETYPKVRCITGPNEEYKFCMGCVVERLEHLFKHRFKGYASGKSWQEMELILNDRSKLGLFQCIQLDGSGFDRTQYEELKELCEKRIYNWLVDNGKIHHVEPEIFRAQATKPTVKIFGMATKINTLTGKREFDRMGHYEKTGCTQTGNADTTFANTLRMIMYLRFCVEKVAGIPKESYDLDCAGDDGAVFNNPLVGDQIKESIYKVFTVKKTGVYGLGQIAKYVKITDYSGLDFCSTETYFCPGCASWKKVRKLERTLTLTPWSRSALHMSSYEQKLYMEALALANTMWMGTLPIFNEYNQLLLRFSQKIKVDKVKLKKQTAKIKLPTTPHYDVLYQDSRHDRFENLLTVFEPDEARGLVDRLSPKKSCCAQAYEQYLFYHYNLSKLDIGKICELFNKATDIETEITSPLFTMAFNFKKEKDKTEYFDL